MSHPLLVLFLSSCAHVSPAPEQVPLEVRFRTALVDVLRCTGVCGDRDYVVLAGESTSDGCVTYPVQHCDYADRITCCDSDAAVECFHAGLPERAILDCSVEGGCVETYRRGDL
ncbi:hypothetical protein [Sandaracinus amylolyticus]|uniref:hypothetical protein n=1 Tax=Sandaracinus amylolyticus TaxID=927083 RepID=UPI001F2DE8BD|nr:hypothetical protein [Sandaracinus amylolyticus]